MEEGGRKYINPLINTGRRMYNPINQKYHIEKSIPRSVENRERHKPEFY
jgi:hypothetical protein